MTPIQKRRRKHMIEGARIALKHASQIAASTRSTPHSDYVEMIKDLIARAILLELPATKLIDKHLGKSNEQ